MSIDTSTKLGEILESASNCIEHMTGARFSAQKLAEIEKIGDLYNEKEYALKLLDFYSDNALGFLKDILEELTKVNECKF
jgi:hypothetical protein